MSILFADPVGQYNANTYFTDLWTEFGWFSNNDDTKPTVDTTGNRRGGHCLKFLPAQSGVNPLMITVAPSGNTAIVGFAFKTGDGTAGAGFSGLRTAASGGNSVNVVAANGGTGDVAINQIVAVRKDYYTQVALSLNANGTITAYPGDATTKPSASVGCDRIGTAFGTTTRSLLHGQWYAMELKVLSHASAGTIELRVNEEVWLNLTGLDTIADDGAVGWNGVLIGAPMVNTITCSFNYHDVRVLDTNTSDQDNDLADFIGDVAIDVVFPTADGAMTDWTCSTGSSHYALVDEMPPNDDTDYNGSSTANNIDSFVIPGVPIAGASVIAVGAMINARRVNSGPSATQVGFRIGGSNYVIGSAIGNTASYSYQQAFVNKQPSDHSGWTTAEVAAAEPLYKKTA